MLDAGAQQCVRSAHDCVVDDEAGRTLLFVELSHPSSQTLRVAGICRDRVDPGSGVCESVSEIAESVRAASHQGHSITTVGKATSDRHSETRPGTNQQKT